MHQGVWPALIVGVCFCGGAIAQAATTHGGHGTSEAADLDPVVITASRSPEHVSRSLAPVTVITRADIERLQPHELPDLLVGLPGVNFASNGGPGKSTSLFLRGTESNHVLMLIDGVRIGSATSGSPSFEQIPVDLIERIEIVRGPRSSLYGSEALGGVIQVFTRRGASGTAVPSFMIGGGNLGSARAELGLRGSIGNAWYAVGLAGRTTDGVDVRPIQNEPDRDGYRNVSGLLRGGWRFDNGVELSGTWLRAEGFNEFDGASNNESETVQQVVGAELSLSPTAWWNMRFNAGQSQDHSDNLLNGTFVSRFDTTRDHYSWQNDLRVAAGHQLTVGADLLEDQVDGTTAYAEDSRRNRAAFAQYQVALGHHDLQLSVRHDDNEQFGSKNTGGIAWGYRFNEALRFTAAWGTAFKAPTFNELYFPDYGNPDLGPESATNYELGLRGDWLLAGHSSLRWGLTAFRLDIDDLIAYDSDIQGPANINKAAIRGIEAELGTRIAGWRLQSSYTWLDPETRSAGANHGNQLPRRSRHSGRIDADRDFGRYSLGGTLFAATSRYDNIANTARMGGYATVALRAAMRLNDRWQLQADARNLLDRDYELARTYSLPGRTWFISLRYTPEG